MATFLRAHGVPVVNKGNQDMIPELADHHLVVLYFSAHWCPPCRHFTPMLKKFFETARAMGDDNLRIIFVSKDNSEMEFTQYMYESHGDWWAIPYKDRAMEDKMCRQFGVNGVPTVAVVNSMGHNVAPHAREEVMRAAQGASTEVLRVLASWRAAVGMPAAPVGASSAQLPTRAKVVVFGLKGGAEHNGKAGTVKGYQADRERYVVELEDGRQMALRMSNLLQALEVEFGAEHEPGEIFGIADEGILVRSGEEEKVCSEADMVLPAGARVRLAGLSKQEYNNRIVEVKTFDGDAGRYLVQLSDGKQLRIGPDKVRLQLGAEEASG